MEKYKLAQLQKSVKDRNGKKIRLRWNTATEVRRSLARVNNMVLNGEILKGDANAIYYSANLILKAIELESVEASRNSRKQQES